MASSKASTSAAVRARLDHPVIDRATAMVPRLFYERLDEFGIDFGMLYTSLGLFFVGNVLTNFID